MVIANPVDKIAASSYIKETLNIGLTLSHFIGLNFNFMDGELFSFIPIDFDNAKIINFTHGQNFPNTAIREAVCKLIEEFMTDHSDLVLFLENNLVRPSDPWLTKTLVSTIQHENEIYHYCTISKSETMGVSYNFNEAISETISAADDAYPPLIGVISICPSSLYDHPPGMFGTLQREELEMIAKKAVFIIVGAYDGEGYIIWCQTAEILKTTALKSLLQK